MTPPTPTIDVERLAEEAAQAAHPNDLLKDGPEAWQAKFRKLFAALALEEAAKLVETHSFKTRWIHAGTNSGEVKPCEHAQLVRALGAIDRAQYPSRHKGELL